MASRSPVYENEPREQVGEYFGSSEREGAPAMGIPKYHAWMENRYPKAFLKTCEELQIEELQRTSDQGTKKTITILVKTRSFFSCIIIKFEEQSDSDAQQLIR